MPKFNNVKIFVNFSAYWPNAAMAAGPTRFRVIDRVYAKCVHAAMPMHA